MAIQIQNTLTKKKEEFIPQNLPQKVPTGKGVPSAVSIYTCGVTVYDICHIGHARSLFVFDVIRRFLKFKGYKVKFVRNITDIDDKIIKKAQEELKKNPTKLGDLRNATKIVSDKYIEYYYKDLKDLEIDKADIEPKATDHILDMIKFIQGLIDKGFAYEADGSVYFSVRKSKSYGKLSGQSIDKMLKAVRVVPEVEKKDPLDFALWKKSKPDEPAWDSPWGEGRPGWHIECSVMSTKYLGSTLDIHAGGRDLVFPHHENEIAQSEAYTGKPFARYWIHHGLLTINGQKMSKSLGNFVSIQDVLEKYPADILKLFFLEAHYSSPLDFSWEKLDATKAAYERFTILLKRLDREFESGKFGKGNLDNAHSEIEKFEENFIKAMEDDFNTSRALAVLFELVNFCNRILDEAKENQQILIHVVSLIKKLTDVFGLTFKEKHVKTSEAEIKDLIKKRDDLKKKKNFKAADKIRDDLKEKGIIIEDTKEGVLWRRVI